MSPQKIGYSLIGVGGFVVLFMFLADAIGLGKGGIQAAQLLGIELGVVLIILGYAFAISSPAEENSWAAWRSAYRPGLVLPADGHGDGSAGSLLRLLDRPHAVQPGSAIPVLLSLHAR